MGGGALLEMEFGRAETHFDGHCYWYVAEPTPGASSELTAVRVILNALNATTKSEPQPYTSRVRCPHQPAQRQRDPHNLAGWRRLIDSDWVEIV